MSDYEVIFGLDCVGGDQVPIDCAVVKTSDGKPGLMLDGEVFTKESLTPEPAGETKIPVYIHNSPFRRLFSISGDESMTPAAVVAGETGYDQNGLYGYGHAGDVITVTYEGPGAAEITITAIDENGNALSFDTIVQSTEGTFTIPENAALVVIAAPVGE